MAIVCRPTQRTPRHFLRFAGVFFCASYCHLETRIGLRSSSILRTVSKSSFLEFCGSYRHYPANFINPAAVTTTAITTQNNNRTSVLKPENSLSLKFSKSALRDFTALPRDSTNPPRDSTDPPREFTALRISAFETPSPSPEPDILLPVLKLPKREEVAGGSWSSLGPGAVFLSATLTPNSS